ncbi:phage tail protein [Kribbella deserti]|uniref:Tape measure protein n=1 Tax=Kribbella deserti TaxID=1926257 RepID=A0ABV6QDU6_9ACTN
MPDTRDFRADAQRALNRIEKQLKITIPTKVDISGAARELLGEVRKINQRNRLSDARKIRLYTTISTDGMNAEITKALRALSARANNRKLKIKTDLVAATAVVELSKEALDQVKRELDDFRKQTSPLKIAVHPEIAAGAVSFAEKRLALLSRPRRVPLLPYVQSGAAASAATAIAALSGARVLSTYFDRIAQSLTRLDKSVPLIGSLALAVAGLAGWSLSAASNLFALSSSLAQIAGAAFTLPGIFTGTAIAIGTAVAVLKDFDSVFPDIDDKLGKLQDRMSSNFWALAEAPLRRLIDTLLPQFSTGLMGTATALGGFAAQLAASFTTALDGLIVPMFRDLQAAIGVAAMATGAYAGVVATLGAVGAAALPRLAGWFADIATRFDAWLSTAARLGMLQQWIDSGVTAIAELGRVLAGTASILAGVAKAAELAGGSGLAELADGLQRVAATVNGPTFQAALVGVLVAAHEAMNAIATQAGPAFEQVMLRLATTLTSVLPMAGQAIGGLLAGVFSALDNPAVMAGVIAMFTGISHGLTDIAPAIDPAAIALGSLMNVIGTLASVIGPVLGVAFANLASAFTSLVPVIQPVITTLGGGLAAALVAIAPLVGQLVAAFAGLVGGSVLPALSGIIAALVPALSSIGAAIGALLPLVAAVLGPVITGIGQLVAAVLPPVAEAFGQIATALAPVLQLLGQLVAFLVPVLVPVLTFLAGVILDSIVGAVQGAAKVITGLVKILTGLWNFIAGVFTGNWSRAWEGIKQIFSGLIQVIVGLFKIAINVGILGVLRKGLALFKGLWSAGWGAVKTLFTSLWNGIKTYYTGVWGAIREITLTVLNAVKSAVLSGLSSVGGFFVSLGRSIGTTVSSIWSTVRTGFTTGVTNAVTVVKELPSKAKAALAGISVYLVQAGADLVRGFINGIKSLAGAAAEAAGNMARAAIDKAKNLLKINSPSKVFAQIGQYLGQGFIIGILGTRQQVLSAVTKLFGLVNKSGRKQLASFIATTGMRLVGLAGLNERVEKKLKAATERLADLRKEAADYAASIRDKVLATGDITKTEDSSFTGIVDALVAARDRAKQFAAVLAQLKTNGLNKTAIDQIAQAGPEAGLAAAQSILAAGKAGIGKINTLQGQLAQAAGKVGATAADAMYASGIRAAEGLVKGLQAQHKVIEAQMLAIARAMVNVIKHHLKIKSPSKVFTRLGAFVGQGFAAGITSTQAAVQTALQSLTAPRPTGLVAAVDSGLPGGGVTKVLNYYAAPGNSLDSEEDLFAATNRARAGW